MLEPHAKTNSDSVNANDNDWSNRGEYWLKRINPVPQYKARKRRIIHRPLVLNGHGIKLNIDRNTLLIKCGFTHYPQEREEYRFFPNDRQLPSRIVILDGDGSITFDALDWLSEQDVPLVQINWKGEISCVGGASYAANYDLVMHQMELRNNDKSFEFSKWLILQKIKHAISTIKDISGDSVEAQPMIKQMKEQASKIKNHNPENLASLLAVEGIAAAAYFRYWYTLSLKWIGLGRKPVPPEWERIGTRIGGTRKSNQCAVHPVNAILNYAYGILESQVRGQIIAIGADPTIGYMHANGIDRNALVFDLMEPVRPLMDKEILSFVLNRKFSPDDFILNKNGVCRLHPQFARYIVKIVQDIPEIDKITQNCLKQLFGRKISKSVL